MKQIILILLFLLSSILFAQEWSEPINISNMDGSDYLADITIDNNGVIHCVWSHIIETQYRVIYYSSSEDEGETWNNPQIISQNTEHSCYHPKIASDSQNNLYLIYDLNTGNWTETSVQFQMFDGTSWSNPISLTEDYPGANASQKVVIDSDDRIYAFFYWFSFRYRYLENGVWSEVLYPYPNPPDADIGFVDMVADSNDDLHLTGKYIDYGGPNQTIYANYNKNNDEWIELVFIQNEYVSGGEGIALDNEENPHIVTRCSVAPYPYNIDGTQYTYFNGENWSDPILIVEDPYCQMIEIIEDDVYLLDWEKNIDDGNIVIYSQDNSGNWIGEIIYSGNANPSNFLYNSSNLYLIFYGEVESDNLDIYLMKNEINTNVVEENIIQNLSYVNISLSQNYPNPFNPLTKINLSLQKSGYTTLKIFNVRGQLIKTLVNEQLLKGKHSITWDGEDTTGKKVGSGLYLYKLIVNGKTEIIKKCMLLK